MTCVVEARDLYKTVADGPRQLTLLDGVDLTVAAGEQVALWGPSGSGKSTLLQVLGALDPDFRGSVRVCDRDLARLSDAERAWLRNTHLGFVFQAYNLIGHLSALDNVLLPARFSRATPQPRWGRELLGRVGLGDKEHRQPANLSGGERQRVAIARALYHRPRLLLCDEPTGNLDAQTGAEVLALFQELAADGVALLLATHDVAIAERANRRLELSAGRPA